jgi:AcrR family transcriptional regulator
MGKKTTNPRKLPRQERSKVTVEAILEATTRILTEEGYDRSTTNRIAERAGVSIGSLYQYFPNKESLLAALMEKHANEIATLVESRLMDLFDLPPESTVPELVNAVIDAHAIDPQLHRVLNEEIPRSQRLQQMQESEERINNLLRSYLERWNCQTDFQIPQENIEIVVFILSRTVESLCHAAAIERPEYASSQQFKEEVIRLLIPYICHSRSRH